MQVIAHRGIWSDTTENSWSAFEKSIQVGCDRIELDVQATKDGHPVILHDETLERTTSGVGPVKEHTRVELERLTLHNGEAIPFLDQLCARVLPRIEVNVEIKDPEPNFARKCVQIVQQQGLLGQVIFSSFDPVPLMVIAELNVSVRCALVWGIDTLWTSPMDFFFPEKCMQKCGARIFHPQNTFIYGWLMRRMRKLGFEVNGWVSSLDEPPHKREQIWLRMFRLGLDGLCTNAPSELIAWQQARQKEN